MNQVLDFISHEAVMNIILLAFTGLISWILKTEFAKKFWLQRAGVALKTGVVETYQYLVKGLKAASADGTLTEEEKTEARDQALMRATQILKEQGKDLAEYYGPRVAMALIEKYVNQAKSEGRSTNRKSGVAKALLPFLFLPLMTGCFGQKAPKEVQDAQIMRSAALESYGQNTKTILAEVIKAYVKAEEARAKNLREQDIRKFKSLGSTVKTQDAIDTMTGIQDRYSANLAKIYKAAAGLEQAAVKAQADLAIALRLQDIVDKYHAAGMDVKALQGSIDPILGILKTQLKGATK